MKILPGLVRKGGKAQGIRSFDFAKEPHVGDLGNSPSSCKPGYSLAEVVKKNASSGLDSDWIYLFCSDGLLAIKSTTSHCN